MNKKRCLFFSTVLMSLFFAFFIYTVYAEPVPGPQCYLGDGTNLTYCASLSDATTNCNFMPDCGWNPGGCCMGEGYWDDSSKGCWQYDGSQTSCESQSNCQWRANDKNQNPGCPSRVGCCDTKGCWSFQGNQSECEAAFGGLCVYHNDQWCNGCCDPKQCPEILVQSTCENMSKVSAPCSWSEGACNFPSGNGFGFFSDSVSCMSSGGWWNDSGAQCNPPAGGTFTGGSNFMFGGGAHCWFAATESICTNLTGCAYCIAGTGEFGVDNSSSNNACYGKQEGMCAGHDSNGPQTVTNANNTADLQCSDIRLKQICTCGPLPGCKWTNSTSNTGSYCTAGVKTDNEMMNCQPPVQFCEDAAALKNQTLCGELANTYMMPCSWDSTRQQCGFNNVAVFGGGQDRDYADVGSSTQCTAAGGSWITEYYDDSGILKQDSWCEQGAKFDSGSGEAVGNRGNCDTDCWACEFQANGSSWTSAAEAQSACSGSTLAYCQWTSDSHAPNGLGRCDYPKEFSYGSNGDCITQCSGCDMKSDKYSACLSSPAGCKWVNESGNPNGGFCVGDTMRTCDTDCFSCYSSESCNSIGNNCAWDTTQLMCKPAGFTGEVCFDGIDNDNNGYVDCVDPACGFDNACGGGSIGGDCFRYTNGTSCNASVAFTMANGTAINCTWAPDEFGGPGHCDMPGWNCYKFGGDAIQCAATSGCRVRDMSGNGGGFCDVNFSIMEFNSCPSKSEGECTGSCRWVDEQYGADHCEFAVFALCKSMDTNSTACGLNGNCTWQSDPMSPNGGFCNVGCFLPGMTEEQCESQASGLCEFRGSMCESAYFSDVAGPSNAPVGGGFIAKSGCPQYNGNQTACDSNNMTCAWRADVNAHNSVGGAEPDGWCNDKAMSQMFGDKIDSLIVNIGDDGPDSVPPYVDLYSLGIKDLPSAYVFGALLRDYDNPMNYTAVCNGYTLNDGSLGTGSNETRYYWFLDTDGNTTNNCCANYTLNGQIANTCGFEFNLVYQTKNNSGTIEDTKKFLICRDGQWTSSNLLITPNKPDPCKRHSVAVGVDKTTFDGFKDLYNKTKPMRILMTSANASHTKVDPQDSIGPSYYTPGAIDFRFVDCSDPSVKDVKCRNFKNFGFNVFENCHNVGDEDGNGLANCDDPVCVNTPMCGGTFAFAADSNDKKAPLVMFSNVEKLYNAAFIKFDTDEPANGTLYFYLTDSKCLTINSTINDVGDPSFTFDDYKPFHFVPLEQNTLGFDLSNGTAYYYKTRVCDPSGNCGLSECLNFTTKVKEEIRSFIFKMKLPEECTVDIPALNVANTTFSATVGGETFSVGVKTNTSAARNINVTMNCGEMGLTFHGVDLTKPKSIDLERGVVWDEVNDAIGLNSTTKAWDKIVYDMGLGGYGDYLEIDFPVDYDAANTINWCDDSLTDCSEVNDYLDCSSGGVGETSCNIPTSLGFSAYQVVTPGGNNQQNNGGSGGSGGAPIITLNVENKTNGTAPVVSKPSTEEKAEDKTVAEQVQEIVADYSTVIVILAIIIVVIIVAIIVSYIKKR